MFAVTAFASAIVSVVATGPLLNWPSVRSTDGGFQVQMPGPVDESVECVETEMATLTQHSFTCSSGQALWRVSYVDLPRSVLQSQTPDEVLQSAQLGSRTSPRMEVFSESVTNSAVSPTRRFRTVVPNGPVVSHLLVLKSARLYHLMVVCPPDRFRRVGTRGFFESFTLDPR